MILKKAMLGIIALTAFSMAAPPMNGQQVIESVYNRIQPKDQQGDLTMLLINSRGEERKREIRQFIKDDEHVEKKIMFFLSQADVRNTSFMNWSYTQQGKDDDQWIYLPALKKVKRISSEGKNDYFMGSDFTYDDLGDRRPDEDTHTLLREEMYQGEPCYVVESKSKDKDYLYSRTVTWVIKDKWIGLKKDFYDDNNKPLKTLRVVDYKQMDGLWMILHSEMENVQKKHKTVMKLENLKLNQGIKDTQFGERTMIRGI